MAELRFEPGLSEFRFFSILGMPVLEEAPSQTQVVSDSSIAKSLVLGARHPEVRMLPTHLVQPWAR